MTKYINIDIEKLIEMHDAGETITHMAKVLNVSRTTITRREKALGIFPQEGYQKSPISCGEKFIPPLDIDESWALGIIVSDGCLFNSQQKDGTLSKIDVSSKDETLIDNIINIIPSLHKYLNKSKEQYPFYQARCSNKVLATRLQHFGIIPRKSFTIQMKNMDQVKINHFIRGIWDGDGSLSITSRGNNRLITSFVTASPYMRKFVYNNIKTVIGNQFTNCIDGKNYYRIAINRQKLVKQFLDWMYEESSESNRLDRKYNKYYKFYNKE